MNNIKTIIENQKENIKIVKFNNPTKKNAIDANMYIKVTKILNDAATNDSISVVVLTGVGDYYSSGNNLNAAVDAVITGKHELRAKILKEFINSFINFPKLLIAVVNGPAIGIAATTLALCDLVFAAENLIGFIVVPLLQSYFYTPFSKLGLVVEGSSSYMFPRLIRDRKAAELLLFNHKMSAKEGVECGFVNYIYKPEEQSQVWDKIEEVSKLSQQSLTASKKLIRRNVQKEMLNANKAEVEQLMKIWTNDEYLTIILNFVNRKSKV